MPRVQTLVDPFELASSVIPSPEPAAATVQVEPVPPPVTCTASELPTPPTSDAWARARCWCSEE